MRYRYFGAGKHLLSSLASGEARAPRGANKIPLQSMLSVLEHDANHLVRLGYTIRGVMNSTLSLPTMVASGAGAMLLDF